MPVRPSLRSLSITLNIAYIGHNEALQIRISIIDFDLVK